MRQKRQIKITDTKRIMTELGMTNQEIAFRLNTNVRTVQRWWNDTCPSGEKFYRLQMLLQAQKDKENEKKIIQRKNREYIEGILWKKFVKSWGNHIQTCCAANDVRDCPIGLQFKQWSDEKAYLQEGFFESEGWSPYD